MHPCLLIPELLQLIFDQVDSKPSYARLAQVCKAFQDPALDCLYFCLECFFDVVLCLPEDLLGTKKRIQHRDKTRSGVPPVTSTQRLPLSSFRRDMTQADWNVLISYAARVRIIESFGPPVSRKSVQDIYTSLNRCPIPILFPNLHTLNIDSWRCGLQVRLLIGPQLRNLQFYWSICDKFPEIASLDEICPDLESLTTLKQSRMPDFFEPTLAVSRMVRGLQHLQTLRIGALDQETLACLSHTSMLRILGIDVTERTHWLLDPVYFGIRSLDSLSLYCDSLQTCATALPLLLEPSKPSESSPGGDAVIRHLQVTGASPSLLDFTITAARHVSPTHLTSLTILNSHRSFTKPLNAHESLQPLRAFPNLTRFAFTNTVRAYVPIDGAQINDLAASWPRLEELTIAPGTDPAMPFTALMTLFRLCPRLSRLSVDTSMREEDVAALTACPALIVRNERVAVLQMRSAAPGPFDEVVQILCRAVPSLRQIRPPRNYSETHKRIWSDVVRAVIKASEAS